MPQGLENKRRGWPLRPSPSFMHARRHGTPRNKWRRNRESTQKVSTSASTKTYREMGRVARPCNLTPAHRSTNRLGWKPSASCRRPIWPSAWASPTVRRGASRPARSDRLAFGSTPSGIMISRRKSAARTCSGCGRLLFYVERQLAYDYVIRDFFFMLRSLRFHSGVIHPSAL